MQVTEQNRQLAHELELIQLRHERVANLIASMLLMRMAMAQPGATA